jgi:hypothetical protein
MSDAHPIERFWSLLLTGNGEGVAALLEPSGSWDDPLYDGAKGDSVRSTAIPRLAAWAQGRAIGKSIKHLRTIADPKRVVIEDVLRLPNGLLQGSRVYDSVVPPSFM